MFFTMSAVLPFFGYLNAQLLLRNFICHKHTISDLVSYHRVGVNPDALELIGGWYESYYTFGFGYVFPMHKLTFPPSTHEATKMFSVPIESHRYSVSHRISHLSWKRPSKSPSPTINLTLPSPLLNYVPKCHFSNTSRDGNSTNSLGTPFQCLPILSVKKFFLVSDLTFTCTT